MIDAHDEGVTQYDLARVLDEYDRGLARAIDRRVATALARRRDLRDLLPRGPRLEEQVGHHSDHEEPAGAHGGQLSAEEQE